MSPKSRPGHTVVVADHWYRIRSWGTCLDHELTQNTSSPPYISGYLPSKQTNLSRWQPPVQVSDSRGTSESLNHWQAAHLSHWKAAHSSHQQVVVQLSYWQVASHASHWEPRSTTEQGNACEGAGEPEIWMLWRLWAVDAVEAISCRCCGGYELWWLWAVDAAEAMSCGCCGGGENGRCCRGYELWMLRRPRKR